jgi:sucrose-6-phosphate hydrolase SacC (GH32 family)
LEVLIDKAVAEIFVDAGARYIVREIPTTAGGHGLELGLGKNTSAINRLEICQMKSMWKAHEASQR